jgi:hypothetical protein
MLASSWLLNFMLLLLLLLLCDTKAALATSCLSVDAYRMCMPGVFELLKDG